MNQIKKIINDDTETLRSVLANADKAMELCNQRRPNFRKKQLGGILIALPSLLLGIAARVYEVRIPIAMSTFLLIAGTLGILYSMWYHHLDSRLYGVQLVYKRCYPQTEKYLSLTNNGKILEIACTKGLDCIVRVTIESSTGEKITFDMRCARKTSPDVTETTLDVSKMTVYFPRNA